MFPTFFQPVFLTFHLKSSTSEDHQNSSPPGTERKSSCSDPIEYSYRYHNNDRDRKKRKDSSSSSSSCSCFQLLMGKRGKRGLDRHPSIHSATSTSMATSSTVVGDSFRRNSLEKMSRENSSPNLICSSTTTTTKTAICHCKRWKLKKCSWCVMRLENQSTSISHHATSNKLLYNQMSQKEDKVDKVRATSTAPEVTGGIKIEKKGRWFCNLKNVL